MTCGGAEGFTESLGQLQQSLNFLIELLCRANSSLGLLRFALFPVSCRKQAKIPCQLSQILSLLLTHRLFALRPFVLHSSDLRTGPKTSATPKINDADADDTRKNEQNNRRTSPIKEHRH